MAADVDLAWVTLERGGVNFTVGGNGNEPTIQSHLGSEDVGGWGQFQKKKKVLVPPFFIPLHGSRGLRSL